MENLHRFVMLYVKKTSRAFTLMETLVAVAILSLTVTAGFRLLTMSLKLLNEIETEKNLLAYAQKLLLKFNADPKTQDSGTDEASHFSWTSHHSSVKINDWDLKYKRVTLNSNGKTISFFIPDI